MGLTEIIARYTELFNIIFSFLDPVAKLTAIILGIGIMYDLWWIIHRIRKNAQSYDENGGLKK
jgi:hypothetical protein